jgi:hypothetical protein
MTRRHPNRPPDDRPDAFVQYMYFNGRLHCVGSFDTLEEAETAVAEKRLELERATDHDKSIDDGSLWPEGGW